MATKTLPPKDRKEQDDRYNPGNEDFQNLIDANYSSDEKKRLDTLSKGEKSAKAPEEGEAKTAGQLREQESSATQPGEGDFKYQTGGDSKQPSRRRFSRRRALAVGGIGGGIIGLTALLFMVALPLKLEFIIKNLAKELGAVPEAVIDKRMNFLVSRYLSNRIYQASTNTNDFYVCKAGGVACNTFQNWRVNNFEQKMGLTIESNRTPGDTASRWKITYRDGASITGVGGSLQEVDGQVYREINSSREMRQIITDEVKKNTSWHQWYKRYAMRKLLVKKYGIRSFRGPAAVAAATIDKWQDTYNQSKNKVKQTMWTNTAGRVIPRFGAYVNCILGSYSCADLLDKARVGGKLASPSDGELRDIDGEVEQANNDTADKIGKGEDPGSLSKFISSKLLGSAVAGIGVLDLAAKAIDAIDDGDLNIIAYDIGEHSYTGFAAEVMTISDKMKDGELDMANFANAMEIMNGMEQSPLMQAEIQGFEQGPGPVARDCDPHDDNPSKTTLREGQYVCDDNLIGKDFTSFINYDAAWWQALTVFADAWNSTIGKVIQALGGLVDFLLSKLIPDSWLAKVTEAIAKLFALIFDIPVNGQETGAAAYDAFSGGSHVSYNSTMQFGVDETGQAMGGGGKHLSKAEFAAIQREYGEEQQTQYANASLKDKLFSLDLKGSLLGTLVARTPTSPVSLAVSPLSSLGTLAAPYASADVERPTNPFNIVHYGYNLDDPDLEADPARYTEEFCKESAARRADSFDRHDHSVPIPFYNVTDPCALEKMVTDIGGAEFTDEVAPAYNLYGSGDAANGGDTEIDPNVEISSDGWAWPLQRNINPGPCYGGPRVHAGMDMNSETSNNRVLAMHDGTVTKARPTADDAAGVYVTIKSTDGVFYSFEHLRVGSLRVKVGDKVKVGQVVGIAGLTGNVSVSSSAAHLHIVTSTIDELGSYGNLSSTFDPMKILGKIKAPEGYKCYVS